MTQPNDLSPTEQTNAAEQVPLDEEALGHATSHHDVEEGISWITWGIGGAALVVVLTAGAVMLSAEPNASEPEEQDAVAAPAAPAPAQAPPLLTPPPLDLGKKLVDAHQRARLWDKSAVLAGVALSIQNNEPSGKVKISFGLPLGQALPGAPLSPKRLVFSYGDGAPERSETESTTVERILPSPNCPLDSAFRGVKQSGVDTSGEVFATYRHSGKHGRPIWALTPMVEPAQQANADEDQDALPEPVTYKVDAENCSLLRR